MSEFRYKHIEESDLDTLMAEDVVFEGKMTFTDPLMIKGQLKGEVQSETGDLYIGEDAVVDAAISAAVVSLRGKIKGNVYARDRIELYASSTLDGDVTTADLNMESGCRFNGVCKMIQGGETHA